MKLKILQVVEMFFSIFEKPSKKDEEFFDKIIFVKDNNIVSAIEAVLADNQQGKLFQM